MLKRYAIIVLLCMAPAQAKDVVVTVDGRQAPWDVNLNPGFVFGNAGSLPPRYVDRLPLHPGSSIRIYATGSVMVSVPAHETSTKPSPGDDNRFRTADQLSVSEQRIVDAHKPPEGNAHLAGGAAPATKSDVAIPPPSVQWADRNAPHSEDGSWGPAGESSQIANGRRGVSGERFPSFYVEEKHYPVHVNELIGVFVDRTGALVSKPFRISRWVSLRVPDASYAIALGLNSDSFGHNAGSFKVLLTNALPKVTIEPLP